MDWNKLLVNQRHGHAVVTAGEFGRSRFHKDHDRIIFSSAFRRLGRKTQVHPLALNDHIHTRLTHSVEVGSVGRSLGIQVGELLDQALPKGVSSYDLGMIVQSACLAHDIGNPPFGHAGEYAIRDWFMRQEDSPLFEGLSDAEKLDLQTFEGNAQGFRMVTTIENHLYDGGLRLTYPTLGALLKYPWTVEHATKGGKFSVFQSEKTILNHLGEELGLVARDTGQWCRHPLAYLVEAADDICYAILDLEDAIELNILTFEDVKPILLEMCGDDEFEAAIFVTEASARRKISAMRGKAMEKMVDAAVDAFFANYDAIMQGQYRGELLLDGENHVARGVQLAKLVARERVFPHNRKAELEVGACTMLSVLLEAFCQAVHENHCKGRDKVSYRSDKILTLMGIHCPSPDQSLYLGYRRALDFISGMTDNYAAYLTRQISGVV